MQVGNINPEILPEPQKEGGWSHKKKAAGAAFEKR